MTGLAGGLQITLDPTTLSAPPADDFPLMQAIFLVITFAVLLANLIIDLVIVAVDPRVRTGEAA
jgi:ABC-type dipeptide/oligopeptide/nickel transport system permease component